MPESATPTKKKRLRTAAEVISRLRWCEIDVYEVPKVRIGYDDRIHGPMEKSLQDYVPIDEGGDLPEHRIQYFRLDNSSSTDESTWRSALFSKAAILWDRVGRVDRIFGSGNGSEAFIPDLTVQHVQQAVATAKRLEQERALRKKEKAKQRARKIAKQHALQIFQATRPEFADSNNSKEILSTKKVRKSDCFSWEPLPVFEFRDDSEGQPCHLTDGHAPIKIVTWNILFDIYKIDQLNENDTAQDRWQALADDLERCDANVIALQEVTERFAAFLFDQPWLKERGYAMSAGPSDLQSVSPFGNLLLWKRESFDLVSPTGSLFVCRHKERCRAVVAALRSIHCPSFVLLCANIHLPADKLEWKLESGECPSRKFARKRELNAVIGKIQLMEQSLSKSKVAVSCVVMGDFNNCEDNEFIDGCFSSNGYHNGFFRDSWKELNGNSAGYTFDPLSNIRAHKSTKRPRRIDRIYVGSCLNQDDCSKEVYFRPVIAELLGCPGTATAIPPSDHYGLIMSFKFHGSNERLRPGKPTHANAWASSAFPVNDTLLALVPETSTVGGTRLFDPSSTLPVPHITLLHGFVELSTDESRLLATQTVRKAVMDSIGCILYGSGLVLPFDRNSLSVFEHRASATLVCKPDINCDEGMWMQRLYQTLCASFRQCREQDHHSQDGWSPHLSIGTFGCTLAAREKLNDLVSSGCWVETRSPINVHSVVLYERSRNDGKFYAVSSVPLMSNRLKNDVNVVLQDAGLSLFTQMRGIATPALFELERACKAELLAVSRGELDAKLCVYGSFGLGTALPMLSDVDVVCVVSPATVATAGSGRNEETIMDNFDLGQFLFGVADQLRLVHPKANLRVRSAAIEGGIRLQMLTGKLWPRAPSVDLLVNVNLLDAGSTAAQEAVGDMEFIRQAITSSDNHQSPNVMEVFAGAVRIMKYWAHQRHIYGGNMGFLGGGGWNVMLADVLLTMKDDETERILCKYKENISAASKELVRYFFEKLSRRTIENMIFNLPKSTVCPNAVATEETFQRNTITVIAPVSGGDFGRNMTRSTAKVLVEEVNAAAASLSAMRKDHFVERRLAAGFRNILQPFIYEEHWAKFDLVLLLEIIDPQAVKRYANSSLFEDMKAWGCKQILSIILRLEHERCIDVEKIRPLSRPIKTVSGNFVFLIRCPSSLSQDFARRRRADIHLLFQESFPSLCEKNDSSEYVELRLTTVEEIRESGLFPINAH